MITRFSTAAVSAALLLTGLLAGPSFAQDGKMTDNKMAPKMASKMQAKPMAKAVYVCKECKMGFTASQAKMMKMKDPMGHKMVMMKALPMGYKMAPAKMDSKMNKMGDGNKMNKMSDGAKTAPKM